MRNYLVGIYMYDTVPVPHLLSGSNPSMLSRVVKALKYIVD